METDPPEAATISIGPAPKRLGFFLSCRVRTALQSSPSICNHCAEVSDKLADKPENDSQSKIPGEGEAIVLESPPDVLKREEADRKKRDEEYKQRQLRITEGLAVLTFFLVLGNGIYDYFMWNQSKTARIAADAAQESAAAANNAARVAGNTLISSKESAKKTLTEMKAQSKAMQDAANAARSQADTSQRALDATIESSHLDERPWVTVVRFVLSNEPDGNKPFNVSCFLINSGKTPAVGVSELAVAEILTAAPNTTWAVTDKGDRTSGSSSVLPPGITNFSTHPSYDRPQPEILSRYFQHQAGIYVSGRLFYKDIFNRPHWTDFCASHIYGTQLTSFTMCPIGNDLDSSK